MLRSILIILITTAGILFALRDCIFALLLYTWYSFVSPLELTYGILAESRLSYVVALVLIISTFFQRKALFRNGFITWTVILFALMAILSLAKFGTYSLRSILQTEEYLLKVALIALISPVAINSTKKLRYYVTTIVISAGLMACYYGIFGLQAGSRSIAGAGRIGDNNGYALMLICLIPLILLLVRRSQGLILKSFYSFITLGTLIALMLTNSRGGFIGLCAVLLLQILSISKKWILPIVLGVSIVFSTLLHFGFLKSVEEYSFAREFEQGKLSQALDDYQARLLTLRDATNTESGQSRIHFWKIALLMAADNPWLGVGYDRFYYAFDDYDYSAGQFGPSRSVHSIPMLIIAEMGWLGFFSFLLIISSCLFTFIKLKSLLKNKTDPDSLFIKDLLNCIVISMLGFLVAGSFVVGLTQEIFWALISLLIACNWLVKNNLWMEQSLTKISTDTTQT